jgi:hypothetical protein
MKSSRRQILWPIAASFGLSAAVALPLAHAQMRPSMDVNAISAALQVFASNCKIKIYNPHTLDAECVRPGETFKPNPQTTIELKDKLGVSLVATNNAADARKFMADLIGYYTGRNPPPDPAKDRDFVAEVFEAVPGRQALVYGALKTILPEHESAVAEKAYATAYIQCDLAMTSYTVRTTQRSSTAARQFARDNIVKAARAYEGAKLCK